MFRGSIVVKFFFIFIFLKFFPHRFSTFKISLPTVPIALKFAFLDSTEKIGMIPHVRVMPAWAGSEIT